MDEWDSTWYSAQTYALRFPKYETGKAGGVLIGIAIPIILIIAVILFFLRDMRNTSAPEQQLSTFLTTTLIVS